MSAIITIDQAGIAAGAAGKSRSDGLDTGALVTITSAGSGTSHQAALEWVPVDDDTAVASFLQTTSTTWTFAPKVGVYGTYRILLTVDGEVTRRLFAIRTPVAGLRIPALNERANPLASLLNDGASIVEDSEFNEDIAGGPFASGNYGGYHVDNRELVLKVEELAASTSSAVFHTNVDAEISALPEKTPVDSADVLLMEDSADGDSKAKARVDIVGAKILDSILTSAGEVLVDGGSGTVMYTFS